MAANGNSRNSLRIERHHGRVCCKAKREVELYAVATGLYDLQSLNRGERCLKYASESVECLRFARNRNPTIRNGSSGCEAILLASSLATARVQE